METIQYKCPNCGGELQYKADKQKFGCDYCLSEFTDEEIKQIFSETENTDLSQNVDETVEDVLSLVVLVIALVDVDSGNVHTIVLELCALLLNEEFDATQLTFSLDSLTLDELLTLLDEDVLFPHPTNEIKANTVNIFLFIKITYNLIT